MSPNLYSSPALIGSPVISISVAIFDGMNAETFAQTPPPGTPLLVSVIPNRVSSEATIKSHSAAIDMPAPNAYP